MSNTLCEGCGQHSFLIPLHGGKGGPLHPRHVEVRAAPRRHDAATAGAIRFEPITQQSLGLTSGGFSCRSMIMAPTNDSLDMGPPSPRPNLRGMKHTAAVKAMVEWFFTDFEDPAERTPGTRANTSSSGAAPATRAMNSRMPLAA